MKEIIERLEKSIEGIKVAMETIPKHTSTWNSLNDSLNNVLSVLYDLKNS
ncbi:MAG: hypothetical protein M0P49_02505 [Bacilli bacterium]|nr:hypothetical protein [Bacilli bacterium]